MKERLQGPEEFMKEVPRGQEIIMNEVLRGHEAGVWKIHNVMRWELGRSIML